MTSLVPGQQQTAAAGQPLFIDNIRWTLIVLVICQHAAVTYSHVGGWYYTDGPKPGLGATAVFATLETFDQAFSTGFLFSACGLFCSTCGIRSGSRDCSGQVALRCGVGNTESMCLRPRLPPLCNGKLSKELGVSFCSEFFFRRLPGLRHLLRSVLLLLRAVPVKS